MFGLQWLMQTARRMSEKIAPTRFGMATSQRLLTAPWHVQLRKVISPSETITSEIFVASP